MVRLLPVLALTFSVMVTLAPVAAQAQFSTTVEDYAPYQPQTRCRHHVKDGTREVARWLGRKFDRGNPIASLRGCKDGGTSEHKDGRAIDWMLSANKPKDRAAAKDLLDRLFRADGAGNEAALARRMGIMYVIWNDHMYASYDGFAKDDYHPSSCPRLRNCSATMRHRDHVHISLSLRGGRGRTSWYESRL